MIVSRFTSFTKNFVIYCHQVTKIFRSKFGCASAFSARSPSYLGSHANVAVSVLREVSVNTVLARYHFSSVLWSWLTRRTRGRVPMSWNTFIHKILPKLFYPSWQTTQRVSPFGLVVSIFVCVFGFCWFTRRASPYCVKITASCDIDVGDVRVAEFEEQGQRLVRSSPCCILFVCLPWWVVVSDHQSTRRNIRDLRRVFQVRKLPVCLREALLSLLLLYALRRWL